MEETVVGAKEGGAVVAWGRCHGGRGAPPFWPWTQVVTSLLSHVEPGELRRALGPDVGIVAQVIPAIAELGAPIGVPPPVDPEAARFRAGQAVARFLCGVGDAHPLVVVLEDIHWADLTSLQLLGFLADHVAGARVAVVATYRDADPLADDTLRHVLGDFARRPAIQRHELEGLSDVDIGSCMATLGVSVRPELVTTVWRRTAGNPFFVTELLQLLPQDGVDLANVIPRGVRDVVRSRVAHLPDTTVEVAGGAAVLGQHFALAVLGQVLGMDGGRCSNRSSLRSPLVWWWRMDKGSVATASPTPW